MRVGKGATAPCPPSIDSPALNGGHANALPTLRAARAPIFGTGAAKRSFEFDRLVFSGFVQRRSPDLVRSLVLAAAGTARDAKANIGDRCREAIIRVRSVGIFRFRRAPFPRSCAKPGARCG